MSRLPNLSALRAFEAAARHTSFTSAAEELGLTQAAVSRHIRNLEDEVGVLLFRRSHRAVSLTEAGRRYAKRVHQAFSRLKYREHENEDDRARVTLEVDSLLCQYWLLPRLRHLEDELADISFEIRIHRQGEKMLPVDTDIALTRGAQDWAGFKRFRLLSPRMIGIASPILECETFAKIGSQSLIHYRSAEDWQLLCNAANVQLPQGGRSIIFDEPGQAIEAAFNGLGAATAEDVMVADMFARSHLVPIEGASLTCRAYYMSTRKPRLQTEALKVANWIMQQAEATSKWQLKMHGPQGAHPSP